MTTYLGETKIHQTRFPDLGFARFGRDWRFLDMEHGGTTAGGGSYCTIGPIYKSKAELLGDLSRYATEYYAGSLPA